ARHPAPDVAAAHDDRDLDAEVVARLADFTGDAGDDLGIDVVPGGRVLERLARQLQHDSAEAARHHSPVARSVTGARPYSSPTLTRAKRRTSAPGPSSDTSLPTVVFGSRTNACSSRPLSL